VTKKKFSTGALIICFALCIAALFGVIAFADGVNSPEKVTGLTVTGGENMLTAQWDEVMGADGYRVTIVNASTGATARTVNCTDTKLDVKSLNGAYEYSVTVTAYTLNLGVKSYGDPSDAASAQLTKIFPTKAKNVEASSGTLSVKLSWTAGNYADGYIVYLAEGDSLTELTKTTSTSFEITSLEPNNTYTIKIRSYHTANGWTTYSSYVTVTATPTLSVPSKVSGLKCGTKGTEAYLTWNSSDNADYYIILRYNSKKNAYDKLGTSTKCSYTVTGLTVGTKYTYKVQAVNTEGEFSTMGTRSSAVAATQFKTKNGWFKENGKLYLYLSDKKLKGYQKHSGNYYYLDKTTGAMRTGWIYVNGYKYCFGKTAGTRLNDTWSLVKNNGSYLIKVNKTANTVTIYAKDGAKGYTIPVKAFVCSTGDSTPSGSFSLAYKWRWLCMVDDSYGQWVSQITGNYLFHSVPYWGEKDNNQLDVDEYNKLGTTCSHGCVRLQAADAKFIYDNIPSGTTVTIYSDSSNPGPFGKPTVGKLAADHTWDPTDPNMSYKCDELGCH